MRLVGFRGCAHADTGHVAPPIAAMKSRAPDAEHKLPPRNPDRDVGRPAGLTRKDSTLRRGGSLLHCGISVVSVTEFMSVMGHGTKSLRDSEASGLSEIYTHLRQRFE
jgi:hypothetical protein